MNKLKPPYNVSKVTQRYAIERLKEPERVVSEVRAIASEREMIGDVPTEMFKHFFKSLAESLRCALHISVEGENEHHKVEAIFKCVGRAFRSAVARVRDQQGIPSTKGVL